MVGKAEQRDPAPFFTLIKAFVGTSAARLLMNASLKRALEKKLVVWRGEIDITKESWKGARRHHEHLSAARSEESQCVLENAEPGFYFISLCEQGMESVNPHRGA